MRCVGRRLYVSILLANCDGGRAAHHDYFVLVFMLSARCGYLNQLRLCIKVDCAKLRDVKRVARCFALHLNVAFSTQFVQVYTLATFVCARF